MKNILYISHDGMSDSLGQSQVLPYIIELSKFDYKFTLISLEKKDKFSVQEKEIKRLCNLNNIDWHPISYTNSLPVLKTLIDLRRIYKKAIEVNKINKFDLIHCRSYLPTMIAIRLKRKWNIPLLFDIRGFWLDERVEGNVWNKKNPFFFLIYSILKKYEKQLYRNSDGIISLTEKAVSTIKKILGPTKENHPITVIPCCVDTDFFNYKLIEQNQKDYFLNKFHLKSDDFIISYLGSLSTWYMPDEMFDFYKVLTEKQKNAKFLIITHENPKIYLEKISSKNIDTSNIIFYSATRKEVPILLSLCQVSIFFIIPTFSKSASSPTKMGEILSIGVPVICNAGVGDTDKIVEETNTGIVCHSFNNDEYSKCFHQFMNEKENFNPERLRNEAINSFGLSKGVEKYRMMYKKLLDQE